MVSESGIKNAEDIEKLKEENARLRIVGCLKVKAAEPVSDSDGWISQIAMDGDACPVPVVMRLASGAELATINATAWASASPAIRCSRCNRGRSTRLPSLRTHGMR